MLQWFICLIHSSFRPIKMFCFAWNAILKQNLISHDSLIMYSSFIPTLSPSFFQSEKHIWNRSYWCWLFVNSFVGRSSLLLQTVILCFYFDEVFQTNVPVNYSFIIVISDLIWLHFFGEIVRNFWLRSSWKSFISLLYNKNRTHLQSLFETNEKVEHYFNINCFLSIWSLTIWWIWKFCWEWSSIFEKNVMTIYSLIKYSSIVA